VVRLSSSTKSATHRSTGRWIRPSVTYLSDACASLRDLGIFIDADLTMQTQVTRTCSKCFAALRQLRSIRRLVSSDVLQSLVVALVFSRLDYGSATLAGLPKQLMDRLQSVQNMSSSI